jgi:Metallo-peptidase family M12B Reprolysin-like
MKGMFRLLAVLFLLILTTTAEAGTHIKNYFTDVSPSSAKRIGKPLIQASHYRLISINTRRLKSELAHVSRMRGGAANENVVMTLPLPDGTTHSYYVVANNTMHPDLAAKYPGIKTYNGYGVGASKEYVKLDLTPQGFHAMILTPGKPAVFIDPYHKSKSNYYMVYKRSDFQSQKKMHCGVTTSAKSSFNFYNKHQSNIDFSSCFLRTYRLAVAATIEYTAYQGGQAQAIAAQATTINRVNGVYETDVGVTLQIIGTNNQIVFDGGYPGGVVPYTSGDGFAMITENQANIDFVIGSGNYDIGHVFDQNIGSAGLAGVGVVCNNAVKAWGVTGSSAPVGDPFDIDYVAHEIGHQYAAKHTQNNNCNRNALTAVEPGSGSTIMGYAGICAPNVQNNSDAYFNGINLQEIGTFLDGAGGACAVTAPINPAPVVAAPANITIPKSTPFALTASAGGPGVASFTYAWEQQDNAVSNQPPEPTSTDGPNFRSITPTADTTRYFPSLASLASNGPFTWEVLSSVARTMNFRISVRGNTPGGSCNAYQDMTVTIANVGPFLLTYPTDTNIQWQGNSQKTVTWNVANTDQAPINAATVDIYLSTDGGQTYPTLLAAGVPNNGSSTITVPAIDNITARVMVRSADGNFFTVSSNNFGIYTNGTPVTPPVLSQAARNPLHLSSAYIFVSSLGNVTAQDSFIVNGIASASASLDTQRNVFVIQHVNTPNPVRNVSITVLRAGGFTATSNTITIPGILGQQ